MGRAGSSQLGDEVNSEMESTRYKATFLSVSQSKHPVKSSATTKLCLSPCSLIDHGALLSVRCNDKCVVVRFFYLTFDNDATSAQRSTI